MKKKEDKEEKKQRIKFKNIKKKKIKFKNMKIFFCFFLLGCFLTTKAFYNVSFWEIDVPENSYFTLELLEDMDLSELVSVRLNDESNFLTASRSPNNSGEFFRV